MKPLFNSSLEIKHGSSCVLSMSSPALFIIYLNNLWQHKLFLQPIGNTYQPLGVNWQKDSCVHSEHVYHRQDSPMQRQLVLRSSGPGLQNWKQHSHGGSGVNPSNVVLQNLTSAWYSAMGHLTVWDNSTSDIAVVHPIVWYRCIHSHWLWCLLSCRHLSWLIIIHLILHWLWKNLAMLLTFSHSWPSQTQKKDQFHFLLWGLEIWALL